jgi:hypothetical protein
MLLVMVAERKRFRPNLAELRLASAIRVVFGSYRLAISDIRLFDLGTLLVAFTFRLGARFERR